MEKYEDAVRTVPLLFDYINSNAKTDSPATLKQNLFRIVLTNGQTIKSAWAITESFLDLITDKDFLALVAADEKN